MDRRAFLATGGVCVAGIAGCLGTLSDDDDPTESGGDSTDTDDAVTDDIGSTTDETLTEPDVSAAVDPDPDRTTDGLAPAPDPDAVADIDPAAPETFDTYEQAGYAVPLVPFETALYWYHNQQARFIDTRGRTQYENIHIDGAVLSPVGEPLSAGGVDEWDEAERIVTYCRCPHDLASMRAADLYDAGHVAVFGIDEGLDPWLEDGHPTGPEGDDGDLSVTWDVTGYADTADTGQFAWVRHEPTGQREVARIDEDGAFAMTLHFYEVDSDSRLTLETPPTELAAPARELVGGTVDLTE